MSDTNTAKSVSEKIKERDFNGAYAIYSKAMEDGIAECPLDMIAFSNTIKRYVGSDAYEEWDDWACEFESQN